MVKNMVFSTVMKPLLNKKLISYNRSKENKSISVGDMANKLVHGYRHGEI